MATNIPKSFQPNSKSIKYLNRDFSQFKDALVNFAKTYYPETYKDFSAASPGMMFIEQAAYIGDVLSYYTDYAFKEGLLQSATERKNIINLARFLGYKSYTSKASYGTLTIMQLCPAISDDNGNYSPDPTYMLNIKENSQFSNNNNSYYILNSSVDFSVSSSSSPRVDTVYSRNSDGTPQFFLLSKTGEISSGQVVTKQVVVNTPSKYFKITLDETNVLNVIDIIDSDNNKWYEVDYLAQELVPIAIPNDAEYEGSLSQYKDTVPYILNFLKTSRRYITSIDENNITSIQFGAGITGMDDELLTFDSALVGPGLSNISNVNIPLDPSNFLQNENYGIVPSNTTLTIRYSIGGGIVSNCPSDDIRNIVSILFENKTDGLLPEQVNLLNTVKNSVTVTNSTPCIGGKDAETNEEMKLNATSFFAAQNRAVTQNDYLSRIYSMPSQFGSIAKAQVITNSSLNTSTTRYLSGYLDSNNQSSVQNTPDNYFRQLSLNTTNPFAINVYILSYDNNKNLTSANQAIIKNLITYLKKYRIITDGINIIDGYIINIGIDFTISVYKGYNKKDVLLNCLNSVTDFFNIDKWSFSQPININQLMLEIAKIDGVQSVVNLEIYNKTNQDGNYSSIQYDIQSATKNNIIYPSVDPSIFEVKYPNSDIRGSCS